MHQDEHWSYIITPRPRFSRAVFSDIWHYRDLLYLFVKRDIVTNYKQTILGPLWFFIQPLLTTAMLVIVFGKIAKLAPADTPQILFYLSGVTAWGYFAECLTKTSTTFKDNAFIFGKVYFPRLILPLSIIASSLLKFAIQFALFLAVLLYYLLFEQTDVHLAWQVVLTPFLLMLMAGISLGSGMIITSMTTKYRDLAFLVQFGVQLLMYATPVIQPLSNIINSQYKYLILLNPVTPVIETFRVAFLGKGIFEWAYLGYSFGVMLLLVLAGMYIFNRTEQTFTDTV